jgi:hypothetical protein
MIKDKYISEVLSQEWKHIKSGKSVKVVEWDESMQGFIVDDGGVDLQLYMYKEFFHFFVIRSNERIWVYQDSTEKDQKNKAGWLCVMNGISIFNKFGDTDTHKESMVLSSYVKERIDDVHYTTKNNLQPPWLEEKVGY